MLLCQPLLPIEILPFHSHIMIFPRYTTRGTRNAELLAGLSAEPLVGKRQLQDHGCHGCSRIANFATAKFQNFTVPNGIFEAGRLDVRLNPTTGSIVPNKSVI